MVVKDGRICWQLAGVPYLIVMDGPRRLLPHFMLCYCCKHKLGFYDSQALKTQRHHKIHLLGGVAADQTLMLQHEGLGTIQRNAVIAEE